MFCLKSACDETRLVSWPAARGQRAQVCAALSVPPRPSGPQTCRHAPTSNVHVRLEVRIQRWCCRGDRYSCETRPVGTPPDSGQMLLAAE